MGYFQCLMNGSNGPGDTASRTSFLCPCCLRKLHFALSYAPEPSHPIQRYASMRSVWSKLLSDFGGESPGEQFKSIQKDIAWLDLRIESLSNIKPPSAPEPVALPKAAAPVNPSKASPPPIAAASRASSAAAVFRPTRPNAEKDTAAAKLIVATSRRPVAAAAAQREASSPPLLAALSRGRGATDGAYKDKQLVSQIRAPGR